MKPSVDFHGLAITPFRTDDLIDLLTRSAAARPPATIGYLNAHTVNLALKNDSTLAPSLVNFTHIYADGMSVVREARRLGHAVPERLSAADFFIRFSWAAASRGVSLGLVGGADGLAAECSAHLQREVPGLQIVLHQTGYGIDEVKLCEDLRTQRPDVLLLGMGSPHQEALACRLRDAGITCDVWCVGALFEYFTPGVRPHAPLWMRENGLEWMFRLAQEPRRLGARYLLGNLEFLLRMRLSALRRSPPAAK